MSAIRKDVTIGNCRLILGDMREVLPELGARAKLCLSDVPYRITSGGHASGEMGGCFAKDAYDNSGELFDIVEWEDMAPLIYGALDDDADAIIMVNDREEPKARFAFEGVGFGFHRTLVWDKITATPNRWFMPDMEFAMYLYKGRARIINDCGAKAKTRCRQRDVSQNYLPDDLPTKERLAHATEKPVALMDYWIGLTTDRGDLVIDPFMGSGSTIVAAQQSGRMAIGIEKDPKWFGVACARVAEAVGGGRGEIFFGATIGGAQGEMAL